MCIKIEEEGKKDNSSNPQRRKLSTLIWACCRFEKILTTTHCKIEPHPAKCGFVMCASGRSPALGCERSDKIIPLKRYCTLPPKKQSDGLCHVLLGSKKETAMEYSYASVLSFEPGKQQEGPGCSVDCSVADLKGSLEKIQP